jgi:hypothetical protein
MGSKIIHTATAPDGTKLTRTSSSGRRYSHAVLMKNYKGEWVIVGCSGRLDLAQRMMCADRVLVPLEIVEKTVTAKPRVEQPTLPFMIAGVTFAQVGDEAQATHGKWTIALRTLATAYQATAWPTDAKYEWTHRVYTGKSAILANVVGKVLELIADKEATMTEATNETPPGDLMRP